MRENFRRYQDTLRILGSAVAMFGCWSLVKVLLWLILSWKSELSTLDQYTGLKIIIYVFLGILFAIIIASLFIRLYIGMSAIADSQGKRKRPIYIILSIIIAAFDCYSMGSYLFASISSGEFFNLTDIISAIVDITSVIILIEMIIYSFKFRRIRKQLESEAAHE